MAAAVAGIVSASADKPAWAAAPESSQDPAPGHATPRSGRDAERAEPGEAPLAVIEGLQEEALKVVRQLMEDFPQSSDSIGLMGTVHNHFGNTAEAETWWRKCLDRNPRRADAYGGLARIASGKDEHDKAERLWQKALAVNPRLPGLHGGYAATLTAMGRPDAAATALEAEIRISPGNSENYFLLGQAYLQAKQYEKAVGNYTKAIELRPEDSRPHYGLATAAARLGQRDKAKTHMATFRELRADENKAAAERRKVASSRRWATEILATTHAAAGRMYRVHGRLREAEAHWQRAAALDPNNRTCRRELVDLYTHSHREQEAVPFCQQLQAIDPDNATYHLNAGAVLARLERFDEAEEAIRKGIEAAPRRPVGYRSLIRLLLYRSRNLPETKALARKLVELEPTAANYALLGYACDRNGDGGDAIAAADRAVELDPGNELYRRLRQQLQERK